MEGTIPFGKMYLFVQALHVVTALIASNGMYKGNAIFFQATIYNIHIGPVILVTNMLHDTDRDHGIEFPIYVAVILLAQFDRQTLAKFHT